MKKNKIIEKIENMTEEQLDCLDFKLESIVNPIEPKYKDFEVEGMLEIPEYFNEDVIMDLFLEFVESHHWYFCGTIKEWKDEEE